MLQCLDNSVVGLLLCMCMAETVRVVEVRSNLLFVRASDVKIYTQREGLRAFALCVARKLWQEITGLQYAHQRFH